MATLLLITEDVSLLQEIESLALEHQHLFRWVSSEQSAKDRLSIESYDFLLLDAQSLGLVVSGLVETVWRQAPQTTPILFALKEPQEMLWGAGLLGTKIFFGPDCISKMFSYIDEAPRDYSLVERAGVLYVEDLDAPREIVSNYLQALGYKNVEAVKSASEALEKLACEADKFFCVLADIHMPTMDGIELVKRIRANARTANIPVIILTADPTEENVLECVRAGASGFLAKPPKKKDLLRELEKAQRLVRLSSSPWLYS